MAGKGASGCIGYVLAALFCSHLNNLALAQGWEITPRLIVGETYTDNVFLDPPGDTEQDFVTQITPGVSILRESSRLDLSLDYLMQNLIFIRNSDNNDINHQLRSRATAEVADERLFLDANATVRQIFADAEGRTRLTTSINPFGAGGFGLDNNLSGLDSNRTNSFTYGISPYWTSQLGGYAETIVRYRFEETRFSDQEVSNSDSTTNTVDIAVNSAQRFTALDWNINYLFRDRDRNDFADQNRNDGRQDQINRLDGQARYRFLRDWSLIAEAGYDDSDVSDLESEQGSFWSAGAEWNPSRFIALSAAYGNNQNLLSLQLSPSRRTLFEISRRKRDVGVNPGVRWEGLLQHRTRYWTVTARYFERPETIADVLRTPALVGPEGQPEFTAGTEFVTRGGFNRQRLDANVRFERGRTDISLSTYGERREREVEQDENRYGIRLAWTRQITPRTRSVIGGAWEQDEFEQTDDQDNLWAVGLGLSHFLTERTQGFVAYQYARRDSDRADREYRENRFDLRLQIQF